MTSLEKVGAKKQETTDEKRPKIECEKGREDIEDDNGWLGPGTAGVNVTLASITYSVSVSWELRVVGIKNNKL